jgi:hypothetical protein
MKLVYRTVGMIAMVIGVSIVLTSMDQPGFGQYNAGALVFIIGMLNIILGNRQ